MTCSLDWCDYPSASLGLCSLHYQRQRNGVDLKRPAQRHGEIIGYRAAHYRVVKARGKAAEHDCACGCGEAAAEWALIAGGDKVYYCDKTGRAYSLDPEDYAPMARYCHRLLDGNLPPH